MFYPGDWLRDAALRSCSVAARGLWIDLLCFMHDGTPYGHLAVGKDTPKDTPKGIPEGSLAPMVGLHLPQLRSLLRELERAGVFARTAKGVIFSRRMVRDEQLRQVRAAAGGRSQENPNVPRPKRTSDRAKDIHQGIHEGHPEGHPEGYLEGGDGVPSPAVAVASASKDSNRGYPEEFDTLWAAYPKRAGGNSKSDAHRAWSARLKNGATADEMLAGVQRYARYCEATGKIGTEYVKQAATFFGRGEHFRELWASANGDGGQSRFTPAQLADLDREAARG